MGAEGPQGQGSMLVPGRVTRIHGDLRFLLRNPPPQALIHCPRVNKLAVADCPQLETLMLWSDELTELDLTGALTMI